MVVYTDNRVYVFFAECADQIVCTFLHFRIGTLDSVQFDTIRISACIYAGNRTTTETYTIVVTTYDNNLVACLRFFLQTVTFCSITYTTGKHDDLVVSISFFTFFVFESENRTCNQRLTELVTEIGSTIRCLDQYLFRSLVQPFAYRKNIFPVASTFQSRIRCHVYSCSGYWPRPYTTTHTVASFSTSTCSSAVERFDSRREVVRLSFQGDDTLHILDAEIIRSRLVCWSKLLDYRTLGESYIIFVST